MPRIGVNIRVPEKLAEEYMERILASPGYLIPHVIDSFQWHAAAKLIDEGYRDSEIAFGETFMKERPDRSRAKIPGYFYYVIIKPVSTQELQVRRWWRRIVPYKWYRHIPLRIIEPEQARWWHWILPSRANLSGRLFCGKGYHGTSEPMLEKITGLKSQEKPALIRWRWMRVPKIEWKEKP